VRARAAMIFCMIVLVDLCVVDGDVGCR
jgi:hypothetical protein